MTHEIRVPEVSDGVLEGTVVDVAVAVGDRVEFDQTLLELETDKAVIAIPSPIEGTIAEIKVAQGDSVPIGAVIMVVKSDESPSDTVEAEEEPEPEAQVKEEEQAETEATVKPVEPIAATSPLPASPPADAPVPDEPAIDLSTLRSGDRVAPAAPSVRRLARDLGVDIYQVQGSGPGARIGEADVRGFVRETMQRITGGGPAPAAFGEFAGLHAQRPLPDFGKWGPVSREPLSRIRELTADAMSYAWSTIPMVTQYDHARITEIEKFRKEFNLTASADNRLTMTAILVKICAAALNAFPHFNSSLDLASKELVLKEYVHIGVAVDTPNGLLVPVLRDADEKGIETLAVELNAIAEKARNRKIASADMEGGTFTISNLGGVGGTSFTPIVYSPQVAILGVSTASILPEWDGDKFVPQLDMPLSLTYDHRVIDGADGARFLRWICKALENPLLLVMKGEST